jgi:hypothetical protein
MADGMAEMADGMMDGMEEWRNGGMEEWRKWRPNGGMVEWREWLPTYYIYGTRRRRHRHLLILCSIERNWNVILLTVKK